MLKRWVKECIRVEISEIKNAYQEKLENLPTNLREYL